MSNYKSMADVITEKLSDSMKGWKSNHTKLAELQQALEELKAMVKQSKRFEFHRMPLLSAIASIEKGIIETE